MNLIYNLMDDQVASLIDRLTGAGLDAEQAKNFLPDALKSVMDGLEQIDIQALLRADADTQVSSLMDKIDIPSLARGVGGNNNLTSSGILAIIPRVLGFLKNNPTAAGLMSMPGNNNGAGDAGLTRTLLH
jgi:hypothetical protein